MAQLVAGDGHQHGAEAEFERIRVGCAVSARAGVAAPRHARVVADDAEVFGQGSERRARRRAVGLARRRVGVGFERRVGLLRQVVEVRHLDEVRFFPRGKSVVCSPFHSNLLKNSKNKTPGKPGVHACQA